MKDFVARVGRAYEKSSESTEESEVMAKKVSSVWLYEKTILGVCDWLWNDWVFLIGCSVAF